MCGGSREDIITVVSLGRETRNNRIKILTFFFTIDLYVNWGCGIQLLYKKINKTIWSHEVDYFSPLNSPGSEKCRWKQAVPSLS